MLEPCFCITCKNLMITLEEGRMSTWRLPKKITKRNISKFSKTYCKIDGKAMISTRLDQIFIIFDGNLILIFELFANRASRRSRWRCTHRGGRKCGPCFYRRTVLKILCELLVHNKKCCVSATFCNNYRPPINELCSRDSFL